MSKFVDQEIDPEHVWINISEGKIVLAAVLASHGVLFRGIYKLEDELISTVKDIVDLAKEDKNIRFYVLEKVKEEV